jgi:hypothetical protein
MIYSQVAIALRLQTARYRSTRKRRVKARKKWVLFVTIVVDDLEINQPGTVGAFVVHHVVQVRVAM